ncbi:hypothetical protein G647_00686 [Cladophialophora carrionii CBS 160.54]|uniref:ABC transporter domain-containing protein n=1 Tax=Cladophialophora carrionii CBS 160.54 TaxID=1279043 RepID=V9DQK0_9EURO|nr:uncharacterized protein G647_00686 [Cladophialophora carrionii CBS 160.54]ETI28237.1 hypothetical protein G647_00686 [Cladophialophora carrionii CBS 160.54]
MKGDLQGKIMMNGQVMDEAAIRRVSTYVEQEDAMIGILTARETVDFAARLSMNGNTSKKDRLFRVDELIESFGLQRQADTVVGTPLRKGLSGGQKRRLSVASQLVTSPRLVFLDEPTSGLDSTASFECMKFIRQEAKQHNLIVIASIHQPSTTTFQLFDQLMLLSQGRTCYFGGVSAVEDYFERIGRPIPLHINPAEYLLDLVNTDFGHDDSCADGSLGYVHEAWTASDEHKALMSSAATVSSTAPIFSSHVFHYIVYQAYVFQGMMVNQFRSTIWDCATSSETNEYQCMYPSDLQAQGKIRGSAVLRAYKFSWSDDKVGEWIGIMFAIILVYRILGYLVLMMKKH